MKDEGILDWGGGQTLVIGRVVPIIVDQLRKRRRPRVPQSVNAARGLGGGVQPRPRGFSLKKWVGPFKGKALGTR